MTFGRPDPDYGHFRASRSGHNIPIGGRIVHPLEFGRKVVSIGPAHLPAICSPGTCRLGSCDLRLEHCCRLTPTPGKQEPNWPKAPRI